METQWLLTYYAYAAVFTVVPHYSKASVVGQQQVGDNIASGSGCAAAGSKSRLVLSIYLICLAQGIWQYVPKKGEGFPEDFVPFK